MTIPAAVPALSISVGRRVLVKDLDPDMLIELEDGRHGLVDLVSNTREGIEVSAFPLPRTSSDRYPAGRRTATLYPRDTGVLEVPDAAMLASILGKIAAGSVTWDVAYGPSAAEILSTPGDAVPFDEADWEKRKADNDYIRHVYAVVDGWTVQIALMRP